MDHRNDSKHALCSSFCLRFIFDCLEGLILSAAICKSDFSRIDSEAFMLNLDFLRVAVVQHGLTDLRIVYMDAKDIVDGLVGRFTRIKCRFHMYIPS